MEKENIFVQLPGALLPWYEAHKRDLPWRENGDPYHIWLSEVMLQQTRVEAVRGYYRRFLEAVPALADLANADDALLHKLWEGLGYYSRVRNLKKTAIQICREYNGEFPREPEILQKLPGIGAYTAGAIASIAFGKKAPAVDGNVLRVVARLTDDDTPIDLPVFKNAVGERLSAVYPDDAGAFTQALMELGATVCGPNRKPDCGSCPCKDFCLGHMRGTAEHLPIKLPKKQRRTETLTVLLMHCDGMYALEKRPSGGLLADLWQFPNTPGFLDAQAVIDFAQIQGLHPKQIRRQLQRHHIFTHIRWEMRCYYMDVGEKNRKYTWMTRSEIDDTAALPTAFRQFWEEKDHV